MELAVIIESRYGLDGTANLLLRIAIVKQCLKLGKTSEPIFWGYTLASK